MNHRAADHNQPEREWPTRRRALVVAVVSLIAPGLGHVLMGMWSRALIWFFGFMAFALTVAGDRPGTIWILSAFIALDAYVIAMMEPERTSNSPAERSKPDDGR